MGLSRSTFYNEPQSQPVEEARLVQRLKEIAAEWPVYGYRRVTAEVRAEGVIVNHKRVMRLMTRLFDRFLAFDVHTEQPETPHH